MSKYNHYLMGHFGSCRLIARAFDDCRNRQVKLYAMPGIYDAVGVTDGTDAWIAPAAASPFFRTSTGDVTAIMRRLAAGEDPGPVPDAPATAQKRLRARLVHDPDPIPPTRRRVLLADVPAQEPQPTHLRRRNVII